MSALNGGYGITDNSNEIKTEAILVIKGDNTCVVLARSSYHWQTDIRQIHILNKITS